MLQCICRSKNGKDEVSIGMGKPVGGKCVEEKATSVLGVIGQRPAESCKTTTGTPKTSCARETFLEFV